MGQDGRFRSVSKRVPPSLSKSKSSIPSQSTTGQDGQFRNVPSWYHPHWMMSIPSHIVPHYRMDSLGMFPTGTNLNVLNPNSPSYPKIFLHMLCYNGFNWLQYNEMDHTTWTPHKEIKLIVTIHSLTLHYSSYMLKKTINYTDMKKEHACNYLKAKMFNIF